MRRCGEADRPVCGEEWAPVPDPAYEQGTEKLPVRFPQVFRPIENTLTATVLRSRSRPLTGRFQIRLQSVSLYERVLK